jgi:O-antigen/teichoic acid export membrane protein
VQGRSADGQPSARTLRLRFAYTLVLLALCCLGVAFMSGDVLGGVFGAGLAGSGAAGAVLYLDSHRFFAPYRLHTGQRAVVMWMLVCTGVAFAVALAVAVVFSSPVGLAVAVVLGIVTGVYACQARWRGLSRGS